jgi:hypothetical protein
VSLRLPSPPQQTIIRTFLVGEGEPAPKVVFSAQRYCNVMLITN